MKIILLTLIVWSYLSNVTTIVKYCKSKGQFMVVDLINIIYSPITFISMSTFSLVSKFVSLERPIWSRNV
jgi:hypothetical protein